MQSPVLMCHLFNNSSIQFNASYTFNGKPPVLGDRIEWCKIAGCLILIEMNSLDLHIKGHRTISCTCWLRGHALLCNVLSKYVDVLKIYDVLKMRSQKSTGRCRKLPNAVL